MTAPDDLLVVPPRLTDAATSARAVADTVRESDVVDPLRTVSKGLPGSSTGAAADELTGRWARSTAALADEVARHAASLSACADDYAHADRTTAEALQPADAPATPSPGAGAIPGALG